MLLQKYSLNIHFYRVMKGLNFLNVRYLRLTHCVFPRRVASIRKTLPGSSTNTQVQSVAGEFNMTPSSKINNNFYGIESDEGVIHIEQSTGKNAMELGQDTFVEQFSSKIIQEKVKNLRFGNIRWDKENKPMFHGRFKNSSKEMDRVLQNEFVDRNASLSSMKNFPTTLDKSTDNIKEFKSKEGVKNNATQPFHENNVHVSQSTDAVKNEESTNFIDELYFSTQTINNKNIDYPNNTTFEKNRDNASFIDELYFPNQGTENEYIPVSKNISEIPDVLDQEMSLDSISTKNKHSDDSDEINFMGKETQNERFTTIVNDSSEASVSDYQQKRGKNVSAQVVDRNSYIEDLYFPNEVTQCNDDNKISTSHLKEENCSFIDETYFGDKLNKDLDNIKFVKENQESSSHVSPDKSDNKTIFCPDPPAISYATDQIHQPEDVKKVTLDIGFAQNNLNSNHDSYLLKPDYKHLNTTEKEVKQQTHNLNNKKLLTNHEDPQVIMKSHKGVIKEVLTDKLIQETQNSNEKTLERVHSSDVQKENQADEINTAFDFVKKLRNERTQVQPNIKGGKVLPCREKLDSKGFRILKNQAPNLLYFTREEILNLLKSNVLYSDNDVVVLNKPYSLVIHESKTTKDVCLSHYLDELATELDKEHENPKLMTVHRLDKETCGCLLLARNEGAADRLKLLFAQRKISKTYWIVTTKVPDPLEGVIDIPIAEGTIDNKSRMVLQPKIPGGVPYVSHTKNGKRAVTRYKVVSVSGNAALVEVQPETGIKHQIRVHFGFGISCPILGDHKYSHLTKLAPQKLPADLLQKLHVRQSKVRHIPMHIYARSILIPQYNEGRNLFVMAPMPTHISLNLQKLKFKKK